MHQEPERSLDCAIGGARAQNTGPSDEGLLAASKLARHRRHMPKERIGQIMAAFVQFELTAQRTATSRAREARAAMD